MTTFYHLGRLVFIWIFDHEEVRYLLEQFQCIEKRKCSFDAEEIARNPCHMCSCGRFTYSSLNFRMLPLNCEVHLENMFFSPNWAERCSNAHTRLASTPPACSVVHEHSESSCMRIACVPVHKWCCEAVFGHAVEVDVAGKCVGGCMLMKYYMFARVTSQNERALRKIGPPSNIWASRLTCGWPAAVTFKLCLPDADAYASSPSRSPFKNWGWWLHFTQNILWCSSTAFPWLLCYKNVAKNFLWLGVINSNLLCTMPDW